MMIVYDDKNKVKILCAKNEGLAQGNSTGHTDFLNSWKACMERISRAGTAIEEDNAYMFDLVLKYQQPRISYYIEKLRHAFRFEEPAKRLDLGKRPVLSDVWLQSLPNVRSRIWIDDSRNEFKFLARSSDEADNNSKVALSAQSLRNVENEVSTILSIIDKLSTLDIKMANDPRQGTLLKELLPSLFALWRSTRFQASMKANLHTQFQQSQHPQKRQSEVMAALKFLCRCYYTVVTFIQAANTMQIFQNVECIPVSVPPEPSRVARSKAARAEGTPVEIAKSLGIPLRGTGWIGHLEKQTTEAAFKKLRGETCHVHAEIQMLLY
ncbi:MAG: hypothetical protein M1839_005671 [Geoglossum umbratile]|nr:MAG: hypothetical protein M1839_005671 [Geoglossum umbratile]